MQLYMCVNFMMSIHMHMLSMRMDSDFQNNEVGLWFKRNHKPYLRCTTISNVRTIVSTMHKL